MKENFESLWKIRSQTLSNSRRVDHCYNAFELARLRLVAEDERHFNTIESILLRELIQAGRMDYAMLKRDDLNRKYQEVTIFNRGESEKALVLIDYRRKVGEIIIDIGEFLAIGQALDFRILLMY